MKICHVSPRYSPHTGGVETQVQEISERLVERGHDVTVKTAGRMKSLPKSEIRNGVAVNRYYSLSPNEAFHFAPQLANPRLWKGYDVVHLHNVHALPLSFAALSTQVPTVATTYYHGHSASTFRDRLLDVYRPLLKKILHSVDEIVSVSQWEQQQVRRDFSVESSIIPLGVEVEMFRRGEPLERARPYLFCVARLEDYKGIQHVISALPKLPEYDLIVAGDGPYRERLEQIASNQGVANRVKFLGSINHDKLPGYYKSAEAHVSLSSFESFGLTVAESLASGTPCVLKAATALQDWCVRDDVECVTETDTESIARAIESGVNLSAPSEAVPCWEDVTDSYEAIYLEFV
ncbi:glycosyltransferase family 4 protein [Haloferax denitrificans]|uniref:glycosyltransferase family 4 protein n=1 Tax=Haloferax denitrificans TaxID=35745 RepID=UPI003C6F03BE